MIFKNTHIAFDSLNNPVPYATNSRYLHKIKQNQDTLKKLK